MTRERAALPLVPTIDVRATLSFMASAALHVGVAVVVLLSMLRHKGGAEKLEADDANRRAATVQEYLTKIAENEQAENKPVTPPKPAEFHPPPAQPGPDHVTPTDIPETLGAGAAPPPAAAKPAESIEPTQAEARPTVEATESVESTTTPVEPLAPHVALEDETKGSESPGSGGTDKVTASHATCAPNHAPKNTGPICKKTVVVTSLSVAPSCFTDTLMKTGQTGTLSYPCNGDGEARLTFGKKSFAGASRGGQVEMCAGTEYPFSDGCRWTSAQRVRGSVTSGSLAFDYGEAPKVGQEKKFCARACSASGVVEVR